MADPITVDIYLEFIENQLPSLKAGAYEFSGEQQLAGPGIGGDSNAFTVTLAPYQVKVAGERFALKPADVVSVFPPNNSLGHYANVLPHIALQRDTLPWERMIAMSQDPATGEHLEKTPWMALLVLNQDELLKADGAAPASVAESMEAEQGSAISLAKIPKGPDHSNWPPPTDAGEANDETIRVIYVKKDVLQTLIPQNELELRYLAHARQSRIGLKNIPANATIELFDDKGTLIHRETVKTPGKEGYTSIHCGTLAPGDYTIKVNNQEIPLNLLPGDQIGGEVAVVVANRLPKPGVKSVVHLVSLEGRYKLNGTDIVPNFNDFVDAVPLVSLKSWSFTALTEKETFRNILLHLNHEFLFGINISNALKATLSIDNLKPGFLLGRRPLGTDANITDRAVSVLRDKDHCYYFGEKGAVYNAAGRLLVDANNAVPTTPADAIARIPAHQVHADSAQLSPPEALQVWVQDGVHTFFVSEDVAGKQADSSRLLVYLLPKDNSPSLRLPEREGSSDAVTKANNYLKQGYVPLPHFFRRGGKSVSWYRGPMVPGAMQKTLPEDMFPVRAADELLRYHSANGMFDASYAAAWELGRLLSLKNKRVSLELYRWKRGHSRLLKTMEQQHLHPHLPFRAEAKGTIVLPEHIEQWLSDISLLKGLPFQYLVPDEKMLPNESLRFFYLDPAWIASLLDGALSIGRVNVGHDKTLHGQKLIDSANTAGQITGFLLRSSVVSGWPNLQVNAYKYQFGSDGAAEDQKNDAIPGKNVQGQPTALTLLRMERLSDNVLFCLFQGDIQVLDIHEKPETVHFGFDQKEDGTYRKSPHKADGQESDTPVEIILMQEDEIGSRKVQIEDLFEQFKNNAALGFGSPGSFTAAQFAMTLIEGVSRVRFIRNANLTS